MDESITDLFVPRDGMQDTPSRRQDDSQQPSELEETPATPTLPQQPPGAEGNDESPSSSRWGLRDRVAALGKKATLQDRLLEKLLQQVIPDSESMSSGGDEPLNQGYTSDQTASAFAERPNFNISTMSNNFRRFNARIGVVFQFQAQATRLFTWQQPTHTLSFLAIYTFVCLDPNLLAALPPATILLAILIPAFLARHPAPPKGTLSSEQSVGYSPGGPPLAPAPTVKPAKDFSKDFFRNMRDLQNSMDDFSVVHDKIVAAVVPLTNFSDESLSSSLFLALTAAFLALTISASLLPWRFILLALGWLALLSSHPAAAATLSQAHRTHLAPHERRAAAQLRALSQRDVILDSAPETREVEIFELQRRNADSGEWEPWLFSPSPHDPLSAPRIAGQRAKGTRFFEDVLPPDSWVWSEKKWALDLWSREWVEERIITGVEVETEGERWVYDMYDERDDPSSAANRGVGSDAGYDFEAAGSVVDFSAAARPAGSVMGGRSKAKRMPLPSWEEGDEGEGKRGEWRRRRWVRLVKRKVRTSSFDGSAE